MEIRTATLEDLDAIAAVEAECFPAAEAATKEKFAQRLACDGVSGSTHGNVLWYQMGLTF